MDYLDPRKRQRHTIMLFVGYILIAIAITIMTVLLVYQAYGFGIDRKGTVIQNGLLFVSSQPQGASIFIDNKLEKAKTNTRLTLVAANYDLRIERTGYQSWARPISVVGSQVERFDYPLLIPTKLAKTKLFSYPTAAPTLVTQSPDKRWLVVAQPSTFTSFDVFDLRSPAKAPVTLPIPESIITPAATSQRWELVEWADNNQHILLKHIYDNSYEYILVNRERPVESVNLSQSLKINPTKLSLIDRKFDRYYAYDAATKVLSQASLETTAVTSVLTEVLEYRSYGTDTLLYTSSLGASTGKVRVQLLSGAKTYTIRSLAADTSYLLDITKYDNAFYAVVGASSENKAYIYKDVARQIGGNAFKSPVPTYVLRADGANFVSFSSSAQFVMIENGNQVAVYDIENDEGYSYTLKQPLDAPQTHAVWMDGNRLTYVSGGKQVIVDYDNRNARTLETALPGLVPVFAPNFNYSYTFAPGAATTGATSTETVLQQTALLTPADL